MHQLPSRIHVIIFDLSEVYLSGLKGLERRLESEVSVNSADISEALLSKNLSRFFRWEISEEDYFQSLLDENSWHAYLDVPLLKRLVRENFREIEWTRPIIERLKAQWFRLWLLSVHGREWISYCEDAFRYHVLFDAVSYSFESGICKPRHQSYLEILQRLWTLPENALFIDDSLANVAAAKSLGMEAVLFKNSKDLKKKLLGMGFEL